MGCVSQLASIGVLPSETVPQAVKQLSLTFKPYVAVPTIAQVWRKVQDIQGELRTKVDADFDALCVGWTSDGVGSSSCADSTPL